MRFLSRLKKASGAAAKTAIIHGTGAAIVGDTANNIGSDFKKTFLIKGKKDSPTYSKEKKDFEYWYNTMDFEPEDYERMYKHCAKMSHYFFILSIVIVTYGIFCFSRSFIEGFACIMTATIWFSVYMRFASRAYVIKHFDTLNPYKFLNSFSDILPDTKANIAESIREQFGNRKESFKESDSEVFISINDQEDVPGESNYKIKKD